MQTTLTWTRAKATLTDPGGRAVEYAKARLVVRPDAARLFDNNGALLAHGEPTGVTKSGRDVLITFADGSTWTASKPSGCGCGG